MNTFKSLSEQVFSFVKNEFDALALKIFRFQAEQNSVYKSYLQNLGVNIDSINTIDKIPFLPIELFKTKEVKTGKWDSQGFFESSGTSGAISSKHFYPNLDIYLKNCESIFNEFYGDSSEFVWLALLPSYLERGGSGLVTMADYFISKSKHNESGFYLDDHKLLIEKLRELQKDRKKTILLGVTFALLDLRIKLDIQYPELIVMETGGMKGRREEMVRNDIHEVIKTRFLVDQVHSEYGMTELFSQAYSKGGGIFCPGSTMKVIMRDVNDPLTVSNNLRSGGLNIIDLANLHSCSFIETKDLGIVYGDGSFEVLGRIDNSDIRGCNLMLL